MYSEMTQNGNKPPKQNKKYQQKWKNIFFSTEYI